MRPRVFPAEDFRVATVERARRHASMRPRVFPAEDLEETANRSLTFWASMRPRVFPAEDESVAQSSRSAQRLQ